jgi:uncharacterized protein involved in exopolysaccharide biosynthesis
MNKAGNTGWKPEADPEYGQRLIPYLAKRYRWLLAGGIVLGGLVFGVVSLFTAPSYSTLGTLHVTKNTASSSLLSGLPMLGGAESTLADEIQILKSREIGWEVIDEVGLQVNVYDPHTADAPLERIKRRFFTPSAAITRDEMYSRLTIRSVDVSPNMLGAKHAWISADAEGTWQFEEQTGSAGDAVSGSTYSFRPIFGTAHGANDRYKLTILPDYKAWGEYSGHLSVAPVSQRGNIISVRFAHANPLVAKQVVDKVIEKYLDYTRTLAFGDFDLMLEFITGEAAATTSRLDALMGELAQYREDNQIYAEAAQGATGVQLLAELSRNRADQRIQLKQIDNVLEMIRSRTPEEVSATIQAPATSLPIEQELTSQLAGLIQSLKEARQTMTGVHPQVVSLEDQTSTVLGQIEESLTSSRSSIKTAVGGLDASIAQTRSQLSALPEASGKIALLTGEIEACQQVLALMMEQEAQTKLRRAGTSTDVRMRDAPPMPAKRDKPRIARDGVIGLAVGALIAVLVLLALEAMQHGFRSLRELRAGLGLNILAVLPGPQARRHWQPASIDPAHAKRLKQVLASGHQLVAVVHLGRHPSYDLCWALASKLADEDKPVLLIDADMLSGHLSRTLNQSDGAGFAEACVNPARLKELAVSLRESRCLLKPGQGEIAAEWLKSLVQTAQERYARVLICLPAPGRWLNPQQWASSLGEVVLTVPQGGATRTEIDDTLARLQGLGLSIRGVVVTNYSTARDPLGREELPYVAVTPSGHA